MRPRIAIIGAGPSGLAAALRLSGTVDAEIHLLEASDQLGGLGSTFTWEEAHIDRFYHCIMPSDEALLEAINELGLDEAVYWKMTRMGFAVDGDRYPFNGAIDLLRFRPLKFWERIRFGVVSLLLRRAGKGKDLDNIRMEDWLCGLYGRAIWEKLLKALFVSKFGEHAGDLPAYYLWSRLGRESNTSKRGYLRGGLHNLITTFEKRLVAQGVKIHRKTAVSKLTDLRDGVEVTFQGGEKSIFDDVICTVHLPVLQRLLEGGRWGDRVPVPQVGYSGVVNALFLLKRPLDNLYWAPVLGGESEFDGVVEMTELVDLEQYRGHHAVYAMKYTTLEAPLFAEDPESIRSRWTDQMLDLYADLDLSRDEIAEVFVFKAPFVEPIYPTGYNDLKPPMEIAGSRLLLACAAQAYPEDTSWNTSVGLGVEAARLVEERIRTSPEVHPALSEAGKSPQTWQGIPPVPGQ